MARVRLVQAISIKSYPHSGGLTAIDKMRYFGSCKPVDVSIFYPALTISVFTLELRPIFLDELKNIRLTIIRTATHRKRKLLSSFTKKLSKPSLKLSGEKSRSRNILMLKKCFWLFRGIRIGRIYMMKCDTFSRSIPPL